MRQRVMNKGGNMATLRLELTVPVKLKKKGEFYIASCSVLDVHSQGKTERKAMENLKEAIRLFLETCFEMGTLDEVLREAGVHVAHRTSARTKARMISVPLSLAA